MSYLYGATCKGTLELGPKEESGEEGDTNAIRIEGDGSASTESS